MTIRGTHTNPSTCSAVTGKCMVFFGIWALACSYSISCKNNKALNILERFIKKGRSYPHLALWQWCPECLPEEHWHGRWENHAAYCENVQGSQSSLHPPEQAHLLGTFGSLTRSLNEEEREGYYAAGKEKALFRKYRTKYIRCIEIPKIL